MTPEQTDSVNAMLTHIAATGVSRTDLIVAVCQCREWADRGDGVSLGLVGVEASELPAVRSLAVICMACPTADAAVLVVNTVTSWILDRLEAARASRRLQSS